MQYEDPCLVLFRRFYIDQVRFMRGFWARRDNIEPNSYGNVAGWLAVCHSRYCIKTTKPILKLFRPSDSPIIEAFGAPYADTKFQGEPLHRGR